MMISNRYVSPALTRRTVSSSDRAASWIKSSFITLQSAGSPKGYSCNQTLSPNSVPVESKGGSDLMLANEARVTRVQQGLRLIFGLVPIVAGADKFFNI